MEKRFNELVAKEESISKKIEKLENQARRINPVSKKLGRKRQLESVAIRLERNTP